MSATHTRRAAPNPLVCVQWGITFPSAIWCIPQQHACVSGRCLLYSTLGMSSFSPCHRHHQHGCTSRADVPTWPDSAQRSHQAVAAGGSGGLCCLRAQRLAPAVVFVGLRHKPITPANPPDHHRAFLRPAAKGCQGLRRCVLQGQGRAGDVPVAAAPQLELG